MRVSDKRKTARPFFNFRLHQAISSSAELATSALVRSSPRRNRERIDKRKTARPFFNFRLHQAISSSVRSRYILVSLTTAFCCAKCANVMRKCDTASLPCIMRSFPRNLQRARSAKFPAQDLLASPITQRAVNVALCVLIRNCSRLSYLLLHPKG